MINLTPLLEECTDALVQAIEEAGDGYASAVVDTTDGYIELQYWHGGKGEMKDVIVYHDNGSETECSNLREAILEAFPNWDEVIEACEVDEWNGNGFASAADYWSWRY